jgi:hypothetical protein
MVYNFIGFGFIFWGLGFGVSIVRGEEYLQMSFGDHVKLILLNIRFAKYKFLI